MAETREALVVFPQGKGVPWWHERNETSPIPGLWPYGLEKLERFGTVRPVEVPAPSRLVRVRERLAGPARPSPRRDASVQAAMAWDEGAGVGMLRSYPARRLVSGVIWVTDTLGRQDLQRRNSKIAKALRQMDALWCLSRPQVEVAQDWLGGGPKVHFLRFGVDPTFYQPAPYPQRPMVASVGGDRDRDPGTLLAALQIVKRERPEVECVVQSRSQVQAPPGVTVVERLPHVGVRDLLSRASVVAIATRPNWHVSGMTVALEAMSIGRPVVASATPGIEDYVHDGSTGHLVPPQDPEQMAARVIELLDEPDRAAAMGRAGSQAVSDTFNVTAMCQAIAEILWPA